MRWSATDPKLIDYYAKELVAMTPQLIVAASTPNLQAVSRETNSIPIVFLLVSEPIEQGFA